MRLKNVLMICMLLLLGACERDSGHFKDTENNQLSLSGRWHLVNYWAIWCKPCIEEIPELNVLHGRLDIDVWGVSFDGLTGGALHSQIAQLGIKFPILVDDPSAFFQQSRPSGLPASMLVNPDGEFVQWLYGPQRAESVLDLISQLD